MVSVSAGRNWNGCCFKYPNLGEILFVSFEVALKTYLIIAISFLDGCVHMGNLIAAHGDEIARFVNSHSMHIGFCSIMKNIRLLPQHHMCLRCVCPYVGNFVAARRGHLVWCHKFCRQRYL